MVRLSPMNADTYRVLFDANPRPIWLFERETRRLLLVNAAAVKLYGWTREELLQMTLTVLRPPDARPTFEKSWAAPNDRKTYAIATRHWKKSGELIDVSLEITHVVLDGRLCSIAITTDVTGIADAQRRVQLLVEHAAEAIALNREDGTLEYVSPAVERSLGYTPAEILAQPRVKRIHPEDHGTWVLPAPFDTQTQRGRVLHRDGTWRWIESTTTNLLREPSVRAYVSNYRDITARIEAEQRQIEMQRRLEYLLSATASVTYSARPFGDFGATFISSNIQLVLGHTAQEFIDHPSFWYQNIHPDAVAKVDAGLREVFDRGQHTIDYRYRHADGSYRHMRDVARLVRDAAGEPLEIVGYWIDVTEQALAQDALRSSEANFRALIERSSMSILVQREGTIIYANPAAAAMLGYSDCRELGGRHVLDFSHPDDRELIRQRMVHTATHGATPPGERRMVRRDGRVFYGEGEAFRLDFDGHPANGVFLRDVTERRDMFERMAVADRMLTVGTLAAGVAHEINNPIAIAATNLSIIAAELPALLAGPPTRHPKADLAGLVADAREGVARVSAIVRDLRSLARPEDETRGPIDITAVLASSVKMAHNEIRHRATLVESYAPKLPLVHGNASRLGQVFLNLLLNAAQAIPEGNAHGNQIRVRVERDGANVIVAIEDTGAGIPTTIIKRIFDPFFTTKAPGIGMGLGLAICHQIVRAIGGDISVTSNVGFGTTFRVSLPSTDAVAITPVAVTAAKHRGARILLVDDEAAVGRSLTALLAGEHEVVLVTRAKDALARLEAGARFG